jgi:exodeoxyribonuclease VII large subunit
VRLNDLRGRLHAQAGVLVQQKRARLAEQAVQLQALSPLAVLARGYAIALHERTGRALLQAEDAQAGDRIELRLHAGTLRTRVEK